MSTAYEANVAWTRYIPPGWHDLYLALLLEVAEIEPGIRVVQAKQKFGALVVYVDQHSDAVARLLQVAEAHSKSVCERCGKRAELAIDKNDVLRALCTEHSMGAKPVKIGRSLPSMNSPPLAQLIPEVGNLPWPLFALDFEASGLGEFTYPIEIGIARWLQPGASIEAWSALIKPTTAWRKHRLWNEASELVHGIRREDLEEGITPEEALTHANLLVSGHFAICDGGEHDLRWLRHLAQAAGDSPNFELRDWATFGRSVAGLDSLGMIEWYRRQAIRHRAGDDALLLLRAIAVGLTRSSG